MTLCSSLGIDTLRHHLELKELRPQVGAEDGHVREEGGQAKREALGDGQAAVGVQRRAVGPTSRRQGGHQPPEVGADALAVLQPRLKKVDGQRRDGALAAVVQHQRAGRVSLIRARAQLVQVQDLREEFRASTVNLGFPGTGTASGRWKEPGRRSVAQLFPKLGKVADIF